MNHLAVNHYCQLNSMEGCISSSALQNELASVGVKDCHLKNILNEESLIVVTPDSRLEEMLTELREQQAIIG